MNKHSVLITVMTVMAAHASASTIAEQCVNDLESIPAFLVENDVGAKDEITHFGQPYFDKVLAEAREAAGRAGTLDACRETLNAYLGIWRKGHLLISDLTPAAQQTDAQRSKQSQEKPDPSFSPTVTFLSKETALLTLPSFAPDYRAPLAALLSRHRKMLANHSNWIIDVRNNGGGDSIYQSLLPWLMPDESENVGFELLATAANIEAQQAFCDLTAPGDKECKAFSDKAITRMRNAQLGTYVQYEEPPIIFKRLKTIEQKRPSRVAVLVNEGCASACEGFLLAVRQSFTVKLIGNRSFGAMDYSSMRPHALPSGTRQLWYAISRSDRLPDVPLDVVGVQPDIYLPKSDDEDDKRTDITRVRRWLEGGSLAPAVTKSPRR